MKRKIWKRFVIGLSVVCAGMVLYCVADPLVRTLLRFGVTPWSINRVEVYAQDHCCGGPQLYVAALPQACYGQLVQSLYLHGGYTMLCACETSGLQYAVHLRNGRYLQVTWVDCGHFVIHNSCGIVYAVVESAALTALSHTQFRRTAPPTPGRSQSSRPGHGGGR